VSRLKIKYLAVGKESRYLSVVAGKGFKRVYYRVIADTSKGRYMLKVLFTEPKRALSFMTTKVQPKGYINTKHWEV
jgi:hypothetical protein